MARTGLTAILFAFAALILGGCNLVMSETPVFTAADSAGGPSFRPGVWAAPEPDCQFDANGPVKAWPKCANASLMGDGTMTDPNDLTKAFGYVLAKGDPPVMQVGLDLSAMADKPEQKDLPKKIYLFMGLKPVSRDDQQRITRFELWIIQCGPLPSHTDPAEKQVLVTKKPLPGMTVKDGNCTPSGKTAVLRAAAPSRAWDKDLKAVYWVRDGVK